MTTQSDDKNLLPRSGTPRREVARMPCPVCVNKKLVEITLKSGDRELIMRSCSACETKWWESNGEAVSLDAVLGAVRV